MKTVKNVTRAPEPSSFGDFFMWSWCERPGNAIDVTLLLYLAHTPDETAFPGL